LNRNDPHAFAMEIKLGRVTCMTLPYTETPKRQHLIKIIYFFKFHIHILLGTKMFTLILCIFEEYFIN